MRFAHLRIVDFPAPLGPTTATISPRPTRRRNAAQRLRGGREPHVDGLERQRFFAHRERKQTNAPATNGDSPAPISKARLGEEMPNTRTQGGVQ